MTEEKELTEITKELLSRINNLKENTKKSMIVGEVNIIKGIIIFETILKEINPSVLNDEKMNMILKTVYDYITKKEEMTQTVNHRIHEGLALCSIILDSYNKEIKRKTLTKEK